MIITSSLTHLIITHHSSKKDGLIGPFFIYNRESYGATVESILSLHGATVESILSRHGATVEYTVLHGATVESYDDTVESYDAIRGHNGIQK